MRKSETKIFNKTSDGVQILNRMIGKDPKMQEILATARMNADVAQLICDARQQARLTQKQLADLVGTKQPVIARLEDADYEGHSLAMLHRIATALHKRLEIRLSALTISRPNNSVGGAPAPGENGFFSGSISRAI